MSKWLAIFMEAGGVAKNAKNAKNIFDNFGKFDSSLKSKIVPFLNPLSNEERAAIVPREHAEREALKNIIYLRDYRHGK